MLKCFVCLITVSLHFCCDRVTSSKVGQDQSLADWTCNCQQGFLLALFAATDCEACAPSYTYKTICWPSLELPYSAEKTGRMVIISSFYLKILYEKHDYRGVKSKGPLPIPSPMLVGREKHHLGKN